MIFRPLIIVVSALALSACQTTTKEKVTRQLVSKTAPAQPVEIAQPGEFTKPKYEEFISAGQKLPLDSITDIDGRYVELAQSSKRKLVILFATWCSDSNRALKALNQSELLNDDSIEIIAIAREEDEAIVKAWRDMHGIKVPLASDPDRAIFKRFAAAGIPRLISVSEDNRVINMALAEGENQLSLIRW